MKVRTVLVAAVAGILTLGLVGAASASHMFWQQDFEQDAAGWSDSDDGWFGTVTHNPAVGTATFEGDASSAPFSWFDEPRDTWPGAYTAEIDVYLDPAWATGTGFDYSVAAWGTDNEHQRDYIFHVGVHTDGRLLVNGDNNSDFAVNDRKLVRAGGEYEVENAGWYTLQHLFYEQDDALHVDMNLLDSDGAQVFTTTRLPRASQAMAETGGNGYAWFTFIDVAGGVEVDNHELFPTRDPQSKGDCKDGGWEDFGFSNQGQCVKFMAAG